MVWEDFLGSLHGWSLSSLLLPLVLLLLVLLLLLLLLLWSVLLLVLLFKLSKFLFFDTSWCLWLCVFIIVNCLFKSISVSIQSSSL